MYPEKSSDSEKNFYTIMDQQLNMNVQHWKKVKVIAGG